MRFSDSFLDEIRDRLPISSVIGTRVTWDRRKTNAGKGDYWACCPFHGEKTPSFHCEDRKGRYHCFGCGVSGDHFRFLTELDGLSFPEAVERVADMAGVAMPARDEQAERREKERASLTDVMEMATRFFEAQLQTSAGAKARAYLRERGLTATTQQTFRLGYSPESRNALKEHLAGKGVEKAQIEACGLVVFGPDIAVPYDRFRDRIMFPIEDARGRIIAFGGRALSSDVPAKYLNSPETELFHKGNLLFNMGRARKSLGKGGTLVAVEGYMDVIALAQAGFENAVAPLGTALTENQLELLWRMSSEPIMCFDGDEAGLRAAWRAAELALPMIAAGRTLRFALLPQGQDPDDLVRAEGVEGFGRVLADARPLADMLWARETQGGVFDTPERKADLERRLREATSRIRDESVRYHYAQEMRDRVMAFFGAQRGAPRTGRGRDQRAGYGRGSKDGGRGGRTGFAVSDSLARSAMVRSGTSMPMREAAIIVSLINHTELIEEHFDEVERIEFTNAELRRLREAVVDVVVHEERLDRTKLRAQLERTGLGESLEQAEALMRRTRQWTALGDASLADAQEAFRQTLHLHRTARSLHNELKAAEIALANDPTDENYRHLIEIQTQFRDSTAIEALIEGFGASAKPDRQAG